VRFTRRHRFSLLMLAVALGIGALLGVLVSKRQIDAIRCVAEVAGMGAVNVSPPSL
jgi:hypothetical protein